MGSFGKISGAVMGLIYLAAGTYIIVSAGFLSLESYQRVLLGAIVIAYGFFRFYKAFKKKESDIEED